MPNTGREPKGNEMFGATVKTITADYMVKDSITHVTVYSNRSLSDGKAVKAATDTLRAHGFMVYDVVVDRSSDRSAMVSATIR